MNFEIRIIGLKLNCFFQQTRRQEPGQGEVQQQRVQAEVQGGAKITAPAQLSKFNFVVKVEFSVAGEKSNVFQVAELAAIKRRVPVDVEQKRNNERIGNKNGGKVQEGLHY